MKADIHPKTHPVIFLDTSSGEKFITSSTLTSDETETIDGVKYFVIKVEISSASHPFFTGKQKLVDTAGRVERFRKRMEKVKKEQDKKAKTIDEGLDEMLHDNAEKKTSDKKEEKAGEKGGKVVELKAKQDEQAAAKEKTDEDSAEEVGEQAKAA